MPPLNELPPPIPSNVLAGVKFQNHQKFPSLAAKNKKNKKIKCPRKHTGDGSGRHGLEGAHLGLVDDRLCELVEVIVAVVGERNAEQCAVQSTMNKYMNVRESGKRFSELIFWLLLVLSRRVVAHGSVKGKCQLNPPFCVTMLMMMSSKTLKTKQKG